MFKYKNYNPKSFRIKRRLLGYTAFELADICKCTKQTICNIELERSNNASMITFIGYTLDILAADKGLTDVFDELDVRIELLENGEDPIFLFDTLISIFSK